MTINTSTMIFITEANQNFPKVADTEAVLVISERLIKQNMKAYEVLAK